MLRVAGSLPPRENQNNNNNEPANSGHTASESGRHSQQTGH
jgi:hypothetical protein